MKRGSVGVPASGTGGLLSGESRREGVDTLENSLKGPGVTHPLGRLCSVPSGAGSRGVGDCTIAHALSLSKLPPCVDPAPGFGCQLERSRSMMCSWACFFPGTHTAGIHPRIHKRIFWRREGGRGEGG